MIPRTLGRYQIQAEIARGAMGEVYRGYDPLCRRVVAIKTIRPEYLSQRYARDYLQRFQREARAAGTLSHPNIVTIYDVSDSYFVMEYLEGKTLLSLLAQRGSLAPPEVVDIVSPIADALDHAHRHGIIHRDVKPSNIMILSDGQPKIMDFGVAHLESTIMTTDGESLGSPPYMSPEQVLGEEPTAQADIFSLGVVAYEMLTGNRPFAGDKILSILFRVVNQQPASPREWNQALPARYDDIFRSVLAKKSNDRYATAADFVRTLQLSKLERIELSAMTKPDEKPGFSAATRRSDTVTLRGVAKAPEEPAWNPRRKIPVGKRLSPVSLTLRLRRATFVASTALLAAAGAAIIAVFVSASASTPLAPAPPEALRVETTPPGATVWLNGDEIGVSPVVVNPVPNGKFDLRVTKKGFLPAEKSLDVYAGVLPPLTVFEMLPARTSLFLTAEPKEAMVRIDGQPVGNSPIEDFPIHPGTHQVQVNREGYRPWSFDVEAQAGESLHLVARLTAVTLHSSGTTREGDLVQLGPDMTPPRRIRGEFASYPTDAIEQGEEGTVTVEMIITEGGHPVDLQVIESAGTILDRALLDAVWAWRFQPAEKDGVKVRVRWRVSQSFRRAQTASKF
jgi:serine/threonine-protein kinase